MMAAISEEQEMYKENVLDHYKNPHNKMKLEHATHSHRELNPLCGDEITLHLKIENNIVAEVGFEGHGCAISQAAISILTDYIKNKTVAELKNLEKSIIINLLGIPVSHTRMKCATLSIKTLRGAIC